MLRSQEFPPGDFFFPELPEELGNGDGPLGVTEGTRLFGSLDLKGFSFLGVVASAVSGVCTEYVALSTSPCASGHGWGERGQQSPRKALS